MQLEIITPDSKVFTGDVKAVQLPGKQGLFQILDNHAPLISTLAEGMVKIDLRDSYKKYDKLNEDLERDEKDEHVLRLSVTGGVVEVQNNKVIVLAD